MKIDSRAPEWWRMRSPRERGLLALLAIAVLTVAGWYGITAPFQRMVAQSAQHRARASQLLVEVESARGTMAAITIPSGASLPDVLTLSAAEAGFALETHREENGREIAISGHAADPARLFGWIKMLSTNHGLVVENMTAVRDETGELRVEVLLVRGAS